MRYLFFCALLILAGLAFLVRSRSSPDGGSHAVQAAVRSPAEEHVQRGSSGLAGVSVRGSSAVRDDAGQAFGEDAVEAGESAVTSSRILVRVVDGDGDLDPLLFQGLRIRARSLRSGGEFDASVTVPVSGAGLLATVDVQAGDVQAGDVQAGGRYRVFVDQGSLPEGYLASGAHPLGPLDSSGIAAAFVEVPFGGEAQVTLRVFRTSSLSGRVTSAGGMGLDGITVRAQGVAPGMAGLFHDVVTEEDGAFELGGLFPVVYGVNVIDTGAHGPALAGWPLPPRQLFDLRYGPYSGVEVRMGAGSITVSGRVVDEQGKAFRDVSVLAYYAGDEAHGVTLDFERTFTWSDHAMLVRSDTTGRFRVPGLRGVPIRVQVGVEEAANGAARRARFVPQPLNVALGERSPQEVKLGDLVLARSQRFIARGRVELGVGEINGVRLKHGRLSVAAVPFAESDGLTSFPGQETGPLVEFDRSSGELTISCEATRMSCAFTVELRGHAATRKQFTLLPAQQGETESGLAPDFPLGLADQVWVFP